LAPGYWIGVYGTSGTGDCAKDWLRVTQANDNRMAVVKSSKSATLDIPATMLRRIRLLAFGLAPGTNIYGEIAMPLPSGSCGTVVFEPSLSYTADVCASNGSNATGWHDLYLRTPPCGGAACRAAAERCLDALSVDGRRRDRRAHCLRKPYRRDATLVSSSTSTPIPLELRKDAKSPPT